MKMFSTFGAVCSLLLAITLYKECEAACKDKPPVAGYNTSIIAGTFYCIGLKVAIEHQEPETRCVECTAINPWQETFKYIVRRESDDGKKINFTATAINLRPPGRQCVTLDDTNEKFCTSALGASSKYYFFYFCNKSKGTYGFWIYYYKRVQGLNGMDPETLAQVKSVMSRNNIPLSDVKEIDNKNCTN